MWALKKNAYNIYLRIDFWTALSVHHRILQLSAPFLIKTRKIFVRLYEQRLPFMKEVANNMWLMLLIRIPEEIWRSSDACSYLGPKGSTSCSPESFERGDLVPAGLARQKWSKLMSPTSRLCGHTWELHRRCPAETIWPLSSPGSFCVAPIPLSNNAVKQDQLLKWSIFASSSISPWKAYVQSILASKTRDDNWLPMQPICSSTHPELPRLQPLCLWRPRMNKGLEVVLVIFRKWIKNFTRLDPWSWPFEGSRSSQESC